MSGAPAGVRRAVVVATRPGALAVVAGLPLVTRAVLTLRALGMAEVAVVAGAQASRVAAALARRGLELGADWLAEAAAATDPVLVVPGDVLLDEAALAPLVGPTEPGRTAVVRARAAAADDVAAVLCAGARLSALLDPLARGADSLAEAARALAAEGAPTIRLGEGLWLPLDPGGSRPAAALTEALLAHQARQAASTDGYLAGFLDRHWSRALTRRLLAWPATPNHVTLASIAVGLAGAAGLTLGSYAGRVAGVLALLVSSVLDGVDGELARARRQQSALGARLDLAGDYVVNLATFLGLGLGLARPGSSMHPHWGLWAGILLLGGVTAAMITIHALFIRPALQRSDDLHAARDGDFGATPVGAVVEKVAGRDYLYVLLLCALAGHVEWFLYAAAIGAWAFVASLLGYAYRRETRRAAS